MTPRIPDTQPSITEREMRYATNAEVNKLDLASCV